MTPAQIIPLVHPLDEPTPGIDAICVDPDPEMTALMDEPTPERTTADVIRDLKEVE